MSADERILRLENAMAMLAELSVNQEQRTGRLEEGFRTLAQVVADQQRLVTDQQRRVSRLEESYVTVVEMLRRHDDRLDGNDVGFDELRAAQADSTRKIAALAEAQAETDRKMVALAEAEVHSDRRMDALIDIVQNRLNGKSEG